MEAAIKLRMQGADVNPLTVMSFSTNGIKPERWNELIDIWKKPDPPDQWGTFVAPLRSAVMLRDVDVIVAEMNTMRKKYPRDISQWLPTIMSELDAVTRDTTYDPRASTHYKGELRTVVGQIGIPHLDRFMKGGIWNNALALFGGISNHGKSTLAYTIAARLIERGIDTLFVSTEMPPNEVTVGVLKPLAHMSDRLVRSKDERVYPYVDMIDRYMPIYDYNYGDVDALNRIMYWHKPKVVIYDYIRVPEGSDTRTPEHQLIARLGSGLATLAGNHGCTIIGFGQFSKEKSEEFKKKHDLREVTLFGSARLYHAADQIGIICRHWSLPDTEFCKCKKDRLPKAYVQANLLDWEFTLGYDGASDSYYQRVENA